MAIYIKKASFFSLKTQFENVGDALINRELIKLTAENSKVYVDLSRCPPDFQKTLGLRDINNVEVVNGFRKLLIKMLREGLSGAMTFWFLSPGGYFGEISRLELLKRSANFGVLWLFSLLGVRICHVGVSYERLGHRHMKFLRSRQRLLTSHYVRDELSLSYAEKCGISVDGLLPDLAFNIFDEKKVKSNLSGKIAICFRSDQQSSQASDVINFVRWMAGILQADEYYIVVQVERDLQISNEIHEELTRLNKKSKVFVCFSDISACEAIYAQCDLVVGNRLHGLLIGASQCGRMLACVSRGVNQKIYGICESIGLKSNIVFIDTREDGFSRNVIDAAMNNKVNGVLQKNALQEGFERLYSE